jgi:multidrug resistance efflux pump
MSDLVQRLRAAAGTAGGSCIWNDEDAVNEAADRIEALEADHRTQNECIADQHDELARLRAELERVGQDARRYQWLRDVDLFSSSHRGPAVSQPTYDNGTFRYNEMLVGEALDAAVDSELDAEAAAKNVADARRPDEPNTGAWITSQDTPQG